MPLTDLKPHIPIPPPGQTRSYPAPTSSGRVSFAYPGKGQSTALSGETVYWIWGDLSTSNEPPLIVLHGGPGIPHGYMLPFAIINADYGIPVIMYDQIGCGESTRFRDRVQDVDFWTIELFVAELDNLVKHLGLQKFDVLGHSWGGCLASEFALQKKPAELRKLIICNSPSDLKNMHAKARNLRSHMPQEVQYALVKGEEAESFESGDAMAALTYVLMLSACRVHPWPKELTDCMAATAEDNTCYRTMSGTSPLTMQHGSLMKGPSLDGRLDQITEQTCPGGLLIVTSAHDIAAAETMTPYFTQPKCRVKWVQFALASHFVMLEETEALMKDIGTFLTLV